MTRITSALAVAALLAAAGPPAGDAGSSTSTGAAGGAERRPSVSPPAPPPKRPGAGLVAAEFEYRCTQTFRHVAWCRCVNERRPPAVDFDAFVLLTSRSRAELGYDDLSNEDKDLLESTLAARDACAALMGWW